IVVSDDGLLWRDISYLADRELYAAAAGAGKVVLVGNGVILVRPVEDLIAEEPAIFAMKVSGGVQLDWRSKRDRIYTIEESRDLREWSPRTNADGAALNFPGT